MKFCKLSIFIFLFTLMLGTTGCVDEAIYNPQEIGDGVADISATVKFESFIPALASRTSGTAIHNINNMMVLVYDGNENEEESRLLRSEYFTTANMTNWSVDQNGNTAMPGDIPGDPDYYDADKNNPHKAEASTPKATFDLKGILYGRYHIYVVANMGQMVPDSIASPSILKRQLLTWNNADPAANNQMFGYFTPANNTSSQGFSAPLLTINQPKTDLHAWIKRAASKVTVAFDTQKLNEDIRIYIHKITIHDIPKKCYLGQDNTPRVEKYEDKDEILWPAGDSITFGTGKADTRGMMIYHQVGAGEKNYWETDQTETDHSEKYNALYFYENMQGDYSDRADKEFYNKVMMDSVKFGNKPIRDYGQPDFKDAVPYGTYIEVEAYYDATRNKERPTKGAIKYRFMLGKNTTFNYDAVRNHHYKLTLRLNGYANEADWHIDYVDIKPEIYAPTKYYISYLYNQPLGEGLPIRLAGNPLSLKAEIIENNWAPYDSTSTTGVPKENPGGDFYWYVNAYTTINTNYAGPGGATSGSNSGPNGNYDINNWKQKCNFVGFLSLRPTTETNVEIPATGWDKDTNGYGPNTMKYLKWYYNNNKEWYVGSLKEGTTNYTDDYNSGNGYILTDGPHPFGSSSYKVSKDEDGSVTVMVPMWTRAKSLVAMTGFSGNNPFDSYMRRAIVRFTATFDTDGDGKADETKYRNVEVLQVKRVVNPKGIWYSKNTVNKFLVKLSELKKTGDKEFSNIISDGKWRATVEIGSDWVELYPVVKDTEETNSTTAIYGSDQSEIQFYYKPKGANTGSDRFGVINVEYNDYTCVHKIFVRQGYDDDVPLVSDDDNTLWSSKNVYAFIPRTGSATTAINTTSTSGLNYIEAIATASPLSIGSYFKRGNYDNAIPERNNLVFPWNTAITSPGLTIISFDSQRNEKEEKKLWTAFWGITSGSGDTNSPNFKWEWAKEIRVGTGVNQVKYRVPTYDEFNTLLNTGDIEFGYGVFYGDGAIETESNIVKAYSYMDEYNKGVTNGNGVRVCAIYNKKTGKQILLPLSASGYGRRNSPYAGRLLYGSADFLLKNTTSNPNNIYRPLNYNLRYSPGAIYWLNSVKLGGHRGTGDDSWAWDINYFCYDFGAHDSGSLSKTATTASRSSDGLPIKLVRTKK